MTPNPHGNPVDIYDHARFEILFWTRGFIGLITYAVCIRTAIYVMHPSYYKPHRWFIQQ